LGVQDLMIPARPDGYGPAQGTSYPAWGGELTRYLFPRAIAQAKQANPQVKGAEAWGWLPPPLMAEGSKVQPDWLHGFLMDPYELRPAAVMRMPHFHMSSEDATRLVNYFTASVGAEFPYEFRSEQRMSYLTAKEADAPDRLQEAMRVVTNGNYCVKCHAVADFHPQGEPATLGPNLAEVTSRLRPDYIRKWVANPKRILPYTGMPVNIPYDPDKPHLGGISQDLIHGTSIQQLDGLVDLLLNFDLYTRRQTSIQSLVQPEAAPAADAGPDNTQELEE
jgi:cbb3-type cytochrome oxidase cytochrome c subunit